MFHHPDCDDHEQVLFARDVSAGLRAIVAVHSTVLGPAFGGCRMWPYRDETEALTDALRLSRGMTYKAAICALPYGGGKSVILGDARRAKTPALLEAMGQVVERLAAATSSPTTSAPPSTTCASCAGDGAHRSRHAGRRATAAGHRLRRVPGDPRRGGPRARPR